MEKPDKIKSVKQQIKESLMEKGLPILKRNLGLENGTEEENTFDISTPEGNTAFVKWFKKDGETNATLGSFKTNEIDKMVEAVGKAFDL